jgi:hypothetical protein
MTKRGASDAGTEGSDTEHGGREPGDAGATRRARKGDIGWETAADRCEAAAAALANERSSAATIEAQAALREAAEKIRAFEEGIAGR